MPIFSPSAYERPAYRWGVLALLTVVYSFNFIDRQLLVILQESIKTEMGLSDKQLGLLSGFSFAIFYVSFGIPIARLADQGTRRSIVAVALAVWSGMTALSGLAQNYMQLLLARIGVAVGEAGGSPPAHAIISDIFEGERRATALAIYSMGINIGVLLGFLLGGWINEFYGWRMAFIVVGLPGVALAVILRLVVAEPVRGLAEGKQFSDAAPPPFKDTLALLWSRPSFRHLSIACGLHAFITYGAGNFLPSLFLRLHEISTGELGTWLALASVSGGAGTFLGGYLSDKLRAGSALVSVGARGDDHRHHPLHPVHLHHRPDLSGPGPELRPGDFLRRVPRAEYRRYPLARGPAHARPVLGHSVLRVESRRPRRRPPVHRLGE